MIRRIANRHRGMRETDLIRLCEALIDSRILYHLPYQNLTKTEQKSIHVLRRKALKLALGVPQYTSLQALEATGMANSLEELLNAQRLSQFQRLRNTTQGRAILHNLGYTTETN